MSLLTFVESHDSFFEFLLGFALIFIGDFFVESFRSGKNASPAVRFLLCTSFVYGVSVIRETAQFLLDYFIRDSCLQDYDYVPEDDMLFFRLFGQGSAQTGQYHVMDTDLDFICMALGCTLGGGILLAVSAIKDKRKAEKEKCNGTKTEKVHAQ